MMVVFIGKRETGIEFGQAQKYKYIQGGKHSIHELSPKVSPFLVDLHN